MDILIATLAFCVTMLALATVTTTLLEALTRFSRTRFTVFTHMLRLVFDKEIEPLVKANPAAFGLLASFSTADMAKLQQAWLDGITDSPLDHDAHQGTFGTFGRLIGLFGTTQTNQMTTEEFVRRLARLDIGRQMNATVGVAIADTVAQIQRRYEEVGDAATEYFKKSSAVISLLIGIGFAFVVNVDATRIFSFFVANPEIAAKVAKDAPTVLTKYEEAAKNLEDTRAALEKTGDADARQQAIKTLDEAKKTIEMARNDVIGLQKLGVPVGWNHFPYCRVSEQANPAEPYCRIGNDGKFPTDAMTPGEALRWFVCVLVTGILIGHGGPFWYDAVTGLSRAVQMLRGGAASGGLGGAGGAGGAGGGGAPGGAGGGGGAGGNTPAKPDMAAIFNAHVAK